MSKNPNEGSRFDVLFGAVKASKKDIETSEHPSAQTSGSPNIQTSKSKDPDYQRTTVYLPKSLHKRLRAVAFAEEREMSDVIEELVAQWLSQKEADKDSDA
jgi:hypothetical protein